MRRRRVTAVAVAAAVALSGATSYLVVHREQPTTRVARPSHFSEIPETQKLRYEATHGEDYSRPLKLRTMSRLVRHAMRQHRTNGYQLRGPHSRWGRRHILSRALQLLRRHLLQFHPNVVWRIRPTGNQKAVWRTRKVDLNPAVYADTEGTRPIDIIVASTLKRFPQINLIGIYNCRYIAGTTTLSQHAYGNAVDWGGPTALLDKVEAWQYEMTKKGYLPMAQLLWRGHDEFSGSGVYDHYDHVHDTGSPMLFGSCNRPGTSSRIVPVEPMPTTTPVYEGNE